MARQELDAVMVELGLAAKSEFVPFSQSRNAKEKSPSLNWRVTLQRNGRDILTTDYSAGCGYAPSDKEKDRVARGYMVAWECEHGAKALGVRWGSQAEAYGGKGGTLQPDTCDVLYSLVTDADVIEHGSFESWASDLGYDADSRSAEKIYRVCLDIALKLRNAIGEDGLAKLRDAAQDY